MEKESSISVELQHEQAKIPELVQKLVDEIKAHGYVTRLLVHPDGKVEYIAVLDTNVVHLISDECFASMDDVYYQRVEPEWACDYSYATVENHNGDLIAHTNDCTEGQFDINVISELTKRFQRDTFYHYTDNREEVLKKYAEKFELAVRYI